MSRLVATAYLFLCVIHGATAALAAWQVFDSADGVAAGEITAILAGEPDLWIGTAGSGISRYDGANWTTYTTDDGLLDNSVKALHLDAGGRLWAGAPVGLSQWDGHRWRPVEASDDLPAGPVTGFLEDRAGRIWVAISGKGVSRFDGTSWQTFQDDLVDPHVNAMIEDHSGALWFATDGGLSRFDGSWTSSIPGVHVTHLFQDRQGTLWAGFGSGSRLAWFDGTNWNESSTIRRVNFIYQDRRDALWVGTRTGLWRRQDEEWTEFATADGLASDEAQLIREDRLGQIWVSSASSAGVSRYDGSRWTVFTTASGLGGDEVTLIEEDRLGNLWFASNDFSPRVTRHDLSNWFVHRKPELPDDSIQTLLVDSHHDLWAGTQNGLVHSHAGAWEIFQDELPGAWVRTVYEDRDSSLWVGTTGGVSRFDGTAWETRFTGQDVKTIFRDSDRTMWFGLNGSGIVRCEESTCDTTRFTDVFHSTQRGLDQIQTIIEDHSHALWVGTAAGAIRDDGSGWERLDGRDQLRNYWIHAILEDVSGRLWFATGQGLFAYNGSTWVKVEDVEGLVGSNFRSLYETQDGDLWTGSDAGVSRFDGERWISFGVPDGLGGVDIGSIAGDEHGNVWFGSEAAGGLTLLEPDRIAPRTVFVPPPPPLSANRTQSISFAPAFGEADIRFAYSVNGGIWVDSPTRFWTGSDLADGIYTFSVRARDLMDNLEDPPSTITFEIDASPPSPRLASPFFGEPVRDRITVRGTADDPRFRSYRVEVRAGGGGASWTLLGESSSPVEEGPLAEWNTLDYADGDYDLRLSVSDTLGLTGAADVSVIVDNQAPFAFETSPAKIQAAAGGDVYTTNREAHVYIPPRGLESDAVVSIVALTSAEVPDSLEENGARRILPGFAVSWEGVALEKPATLELAGAEIADAPGTLALYTLEPDTAGTGMVRTGFQGKMFRSARQPTMVPSAPESRMVPQPPEAEVIHAAPQAEMVQAVPEAAMVGPSPEPGAERWTRVGGTVDGAGRISAKIRTPGFYALFAESRAVELEGSVWGLSLTPRAFSPRGSQGERELAIGFSLARAARVSVRIFSRTGRLVREVAAGAPLTAGENLLRWNGRDSDGELVRSDLYLVTVETLGETVTKTFAVVN
jgi:ligand-binding sensor domain-containing protein